MLGPEHWNQSVGAGRDGEPIWCPERAWDLSEAPEAIGGMQSPEPRLLRPRQAWLLSSPCYKALTGFKPLDSALTNDF